MLFYFLAQAREPTLRFKAYITLVQELLGRIAHRKDEDDLSQRTQRTQRRIFFTLREVPKKQKRPAASQVKDFFATDATGKTNSPQREEEVMAHS